MTKPLDARDPGLPDPLRLAFQPLDKRAFGAAVGTAFGALIAVATLVAVVGQGGEAQRLELLNAYFYGYAVSWGGVFIGFAWAFVTGFVAGWFIAFCRNVGLAVSLFLVKTRAELFQTRDFLDHI